MFYGLHSLPGRLHSLVYLASSGVNEKERGSRSDEKPLGEQRRRDAVPVPALIRRIHRGVYIVSSVYEARFKLFTLAFTFLSPLRPRSLRMPLAAPLRQLPSDPPPLTPGSTGFTRVKNWPRHPCLSPPPAGSFRAVSLNPRYPRADLLGNLSSCVDDIRDPTQLGSLMTSRDANTLTVAPRRSPGRSI